MTDSVVITSDKIWVVRDRVVDGGHISIVWSVADDNNLDVNPMTRTSKR